MTTQKRTKAEVAKCFESSIHLLQRFE